MNKAYSYVRFSSPEQSKGRSFGRQTEECERYCREHGLTLVSGVEYTFLDAGRSAFTGEHLGEKGALKRFLGLVKNGAIHPGSTLIVESLDRISRQDVYTALPIFLDLLAADIRVVTLKDGKVYTKGSSTEDLIISIFIFARANEESSTKARRVADAFAKKRERAAMDGTPMGDVAPMWLALKADGSGYQTVDVAVKAVERIFELSIAGYGKTLIAKMLNAEGFPPPKASRGVNGWGASAVDRVVKNRAVLGEWQPFTRTLDPQRRTRQAIGAPIPNYFPAIISEETFYEAQGAIAGRLKAKATKQSRNFNIWAGVGKCIYCASALHMINKGRSPKGRTYLQCSAGRKGLCKPHKLIRLDQAEGVFRLILGRLDALALVKDSSGALNAQLQAVEGRRAEQELQRDKLGALLVSNPSEFLASAVRNAEVELANLDQKKGRLLAEMASEDAIGFDTFMDRLDLKSFEGRSRANVLLKRLHVLVFAGPDGFVVFESNRVAFAVGLLGGVAGYRELSPWKYARPVSDGPLHKAAQHVLRYALPVRTTPPLQAGPAAYALEEDAVQGYENSLESEGEQVGLTAKER